MNNGFTTLILILLSHICFSFIDTKQKEIKFAPHAQYNKDTLLWTAELKHDKTTASSQLPVHSHDHQEELFSFGNVYVQSESETESDRQLAKRIAAECDLTFLGLVGQLKSIYLFGHQLGYHGDNNATHQLGYHGDSNTTHQYINIDLEYVNHTSITEDIETKLDNHLNVVWYHREKVFSRARRTLHFKDPAYPKQWHLKNHNSNMDINVTGVWENNITGSGITVSVVDDGLEWTNTDILENYSPEGSYDLNSNDKDPMPNGKQDNNHHGTRCAGEIAAVANSYCAVGVAYHAKVSGIRILDGPMTDSLEAKGFNEKLKVNDIYSCSWGPDDDGKTVDGPHFLAAKAIRYGIDFGRNGYGSIYVVASGNGGSFQDNCNYDGYANSIYTVTIGAVDDRGRMPYYAEECASMLAVTFSSGMSTRSIVTTDWTKHGATGCTDRHSGTSAAAPIAAGMIALMLEARPCLTWRDVQYIIIMTAQKVDVDIAHWQRNKAGLYHSHKHGFGLMNAWRLVNAARVWQPVPWLTSYIHSSGDINTKIPKGVDHPLIIKYTVTASDVEGYDLFVLENVQLAVTITHPIRGDLQTVVICPSGTRSVVGAYRSLDRSASGLTDWTFNTVRCWGESPVGEWTIQIADKGRDVFANGYLKRWKLRLFGTPISPDMFLRRHRVLEEAMSGQYLNKSYIPECGEPPNTAKPDAAMAERTVKILTLACMFCLVLTIYQSLEYIFCYNEEKKLIARMRKVNARAQELTTGNDPSETTGLLSPCAPDASGNTELWEEYQMQTFGETNRRDEPAEDDHYYDLRVKLPEQGTSHNRHAGSGNCNNENEIQSDFSSSCNSTTENETDYSSPAISDNHPVSSHISHRAINNLSINSNTQSDEEDDVIFSQVVSSQSDDEEHAHLISSKSS